VEKSGATTLLEKVNKGSNNIGVVVFPKRLISLSEFGNSQCVMDKLIQAKKYNESTKEIEVIGAIEKLGKGGVQVYEFEYTLESIRGGMKRIFFVAFMDSRKLYLLNIAYADHPESPNGSLFNWCYRDGGIGHAAMKFAKAFGLKVTIISTSPSKEKEAIDYLGTDSFIVSRDQAQIKSQCEKEEDNPGLVKYQLPKLLKVSLDTVAA
ncbi:hypothetical protein GIB67_018751, partial [Kingdonia uniflora]